MLAVTDAPAHGETYHSQDCQTVSANLLRNRASGQEPGVKVFTDPFKREKFAGPPGVLDKQQLNPYQSLAFFAI